MNRNSEQCEDGVTVAAITAIVREADKHFERVGGGSRHWVRDCFLPMLNKSGWFVEAYPEPCPCGLGGEPWHMRGICEEGYKRTPAGAPSSDAVDPVGGDGQDGPRA